LSGEFETSEAAFKRSDRNDIQGGFGDPK